MAEPKVALRNIRSIGTIDDPVEVIHVKIIQQLENLSHELSTMGVGTEAFAGQTFDTGTNAITMIENTIMSGTFQTTGIFTPAGHINLANQTYFINGDGLVNKGMTVTTAGKVVCKQGIQVIGAGTVSTTFTVAGEAIFNGEVDVNAKMKMGTNFIGYGATIAKGLGFNASDVGSFTEALVVNDDITSSTGKIRTNSVFNVGGTDGWSGTFDKTVDNTITFAGGMVTGKT